MLAGEFGLNDSKILKYKFISFYKVLFYDGKADNIYVKK